MPTSRDGGPPPPQDFDLGMSVPLDFCSTELSFDADDWINDSSPPLLDDLYNQDPDTLHLFESARAAEAKAFLSPEPGLALSQSGLSPESSLFSSSQDSASVSSSSKRTHSSSSPETRSSSDDIAMTDGPGVKQEVNYDEYLNIEDDPSMGLDGTINPKSIEQPFVRNDFYGGNSFDFHSDSNRSSPDNMATQPAPSPDDMTQVGSNPSMKVEPPSSRGHNKAFSQYSLTHGMSGLKTNASREVSPTTGYYISQDSSPTAVLNSPSPGVSMGFAAGPLLMGQGPEDTQFQAGLPPAVLHTGLPRPPYPNAHIAMPGVPPYTMFPQASYDFSPATYELHIDRIPAKSRVETQIPIKLKLSPLPPGIKRLRLPRHTISKPKLLDKNNTDRHPDMLELHTNLVCTSAMQNEKNKRKAIARGASTRPQFDPAPGDEDDENKPVNGGDIHICKGCVNRERKRAERKKSKKPEEEESWRRDEERRVIVFNTAEIREWSEQPGPGHAPGAASPFYGLLDVPMRIACYCRHHGEKTGFQVLFTIKDWQDQVVAQAFSDSIMITDDHKTHPIPNITAAALKGSDTSLVTPPTANPPSDQLSFDPAASFRASHSTSDLAAMKRQSLPFQPTMSMNQQPQAPSAVPTPRNISRPASPGIQGPSSKKRKANGSTKLPSELAMTRLETAHPPASHAPVSATPSPFSPNAPSFPPVPADSSFAPKPTGQGPGPQPFTNGPPTPNSNTDQLFFNNNRSASLDNLPMAHVYSAPTSAHPSRAPSPSGLRGSISAMHSQARLSQDIQNSLFNMPLAMPMAGPPTHSIINKIIPAEGPKCGGIEVTILGQGFYSGLDVMFGEQKATTTTFWGNSSLVCLVPPSAVAVTVPVTLKQPNQPHVPQFHSNQSRITFRYIDDDEQQLLRTALTVLSRKMTGKFEDAQDIARRIVDTYSRIAPEGSSGGGPAGGGGGMTGYSGNSANFEAQLLKVLELIDLDDSSYKARLNLQRRSTGQSMLHLACALGLHRFVAGLLARGAHPDIRDNGGYTPLHLAALNNHPEIVRRLIHARADPTLRTLSGETAADIAKKVAGSRDILLVMQRIERQHARSRSGGSLYSRASSATSLKSLWEPPSAPLASAEYNTDDSDSGVESPEYSEFASSEDEDGHGSDEEWLDMRRGSIHSRRALDISPVPRLPSPHADVPAAMASPATATMVAFKEQLAAHFQQFLAQIPSSITMPPNPLPDYYQAYLNSAAYQRLTSLMPNINGSRPGSSRDDANPKDMESRWWDLSSLMPSYGMPPAYEEIFPQQDMDTKQASAAAAAAEFEADAKCATLYDQASTSETVVRQVPARLNIGRKNAITEEQRENFRRAHAERRKGLSRDTSLYMFWIPILVLVLVIWFPGVFTKAWAYVPTISFEGAAQKVQGMAPEQVGRTVQSIQQRVAEVL